MAKLHLTVQGKVILCGEHAVVYGVPAIAMPIRKGMKLTLKRSGDENNLGLSFDEGATWVHSDAKGTALSRMLDSLRLKYPVIFNGASVLVQSEIPTSAGLGSSAALSVGLLRLAHLSGGLPDWEAQTLFEDAMILETFFHGRPSGIDHATVIAGDLINFQRDTARGAKWRALTPTNMPRILVAFSGKHEGTQKAVSALAERAKRDAVWFNGRLEEINAITEDMEQAITHNDAKLMGTLFDENHRILKDFGVSTPQLDLICSEAKKAGAYGAKLTGAGCGGAVLAVAPSDQVKDVAEHLKQWSTIL